MTEPSTDGETNDAGGLETAAYAAVDKEDDRVVDADEHFEGPEIMATENDHLSFEELVRRQDAERKLGEWQDRGYSQGWMDAQKEFLDLIDQLEEELENHEPGGSPRFVEGANDGLKSQIEILEDLRSEIRESKQEEGEKS